jgi:hypothetical protein
LALNNMQVNDPRPRKQKFPGEKVHLDFSTLSAAVVDDPVHPDRSSFRGAGWVYLRGWLGRLFSIAQFGVPDFVCDQEGLIER